MAIGAQLSYAPVIFGYRDTVEYLDNGFQGTGALRHEQVITGCLGTGAMAHGYRVTGSLPMLNLVTSGLPDIGAPMAGYRDSGGL